MGKILNKLKDKRGFVWWLIPLIQTVLNQSDNQTGKTVSSALSFIDKKAK